jgi:phosphoglycerate dehydrogenase-like enzyme
LQEGCVDSVEIVSGPDAPDDFDVLVEGRPTEEQFRKSSRLKALIIPFAGAPDTTVSLLLANPQVQGYNLHHNAGDTAELAMGLLLAAAKQIPRQDRLMRTGDWSPRYQPSKAISLFGKTVLIIGYGAIGRHLGRVCLGLGMRVIGVRRRGGPSEGEIEIYSQLDLASLLPRGDVVLLALPRTPETEGLLGERELERLPKGAVLVNVARAQVVDEKALFEALKSRRLHSAGLDVWYRYPRAGDSDVPGYFNMPESATHTYPSEYPFHELDNVVMTPHRGGVTMDTEEKRVQGIAEILNALAAGKPAPNRLDPAAGY